MKRLLSLLFIALSIVVPAMSAPIDKVKALSTAQGYMFSKGRIVDNSSKPRLSPSRRAATASSSEDNEYYYIFNAEGGKGYVIVSGDDRTPEILGYVDSGSYDESAIPENMKSWLQLYVDQIKYLDDNNIEVNRKAMRARRAMNATRHSIPAIMTTKWNQGHPYNMTCPLYYKSDGTTDRPASGCVATALSQVMNHYKWPEKTKTIIPALSNSYKLSDGTVKKVTTKAIPRNTKIDWDNMCNIYNGKQTGAQDSAVANLMKIVGQSVNMGYGGSSGAVFGDNVVKAFVNYFGYDDSAYMASRGDYTIDEWFDLIYNEIATGHPVGFAGSSSGGAHAFVLDGFDGEQLFHVNWGWGGGSDGWFLVGILNPGDNTGMGASSSSDGYSMGQGALCGLKMPDNIRVESSTAMSINDVKISGADINANFINWTGSTNSFNIAVVKLNDDGTYSLASTQQTISNLGNNYYNNKTLTVKGKLPEGTHRVSPASKLATNKTWRPKYDFKRTYIEAVVDASGNTTLRLVEPVEDISIDTIIFPNKPVVNTEQEVKVRFRNNGDEYYREVRFFADITDNKVYTDNRSIVAIPKGGTTEVSFFFKPTNTGIYNLWFCTNNDGTGEVGHTTLEIVTDEEILKDSLSVVSFAFDNMTGSAIYGTKMMGRCNIRNQAKREFKGKVTMQLWRQPAGSNTAWSSSSTTVQMEIAPSRTAPAYFEFSNLDNKATYRIQVRYVEQSGELKGGGLWEHGWNLTPGALLWKNDGSISGTRGAVTQSVSSLACGMYIGGYKVNRFSAVANKNPNTIFAIDENSEVSTSGLEDRNVVVGSHSEKLELYSGYPYYSPVTFDADTAVFHYTLPGEYEPGGWKTFTMPFTPDSICVDGIRCTPNETLSHFWIYEFAQTDDNGMMVFQPAETLRGGTSYLIAADKWMSGHTLDFVGTDVKMYCTGDEKMVVTSPDFKMWGTTYNRTLSGVYVLNNEGTAFDFATDKTLVDGLTAFVTTTLDEGVRPESIALPSVPEFPYRKGDISGDGAVDVKDVIALSGLVIERRVFGNADVADINGDGVVDGADIVALVNIIMN